MSLALLALALSGCGAKPGGVPWTRALAEAAKAGAEFRHAARYTYEAITQESCGNKPALRRATVLAPEIAAIRAFEKQISGTPAAAHLDFARSDNDYLKAKDELGCWADDDPKFAAMHVEISRDMAISGLERLKGLTATLPALPARSTPEKAAEFRAGIVDLVEVIHPLCPPPNPDQVLAPAREAFARFRNQPQIRPYMVDLAVAAADAEYMNSSTIAECIEMQPDPDPGGTALAEVRKRIAALENLVSR